MQHIPTVCPNVLRVAASLNMMLCRDQSMSLPLVINEEKLAVERLEDLLANLPVLSPPQVAVYYTVDADASDNHIGCVLSQQQPDGPDRPIGYWSRALNDKDKELAIAHQQCLDVIWVVLMLCLYLEGNRIPVGIVYEP